LTPLTEYTDRIIVRLKDEPASSKRQAMSQSKAQSLSAKAGAHLLPVRAAGEQTQIVRLTHPMPLADVQKITEKLQQDPTVLYAEPDRRKHAQATPTDPRYAQQWYLFESMGGINAPSAWDITTGSSSIVVAVIDTGVIRTNPDLQSRLLQGYDFIGSDNDLTRSDGDSGTLFATANDGNGRDNDPSDPGNWIAVGEAGVSPFEDCTQPEDSSWHGTHVTGILGAAANNGFGIAGIDWNARILPIRALGKCGGYTSDIMDAARWAAGITVPGVPNNPTPAHVINLSLGGSGSCSAFEQGTINQILSTTNVRAIVTSAGNGGGSASNKSPGNCANVINVGATDRDGNLPAYSNRGLAVAISAPGGNDNTSSFNGSGIISTSNCGETSPILSAAACSNAGDQLATGSPYIAFFFVGTSAATPQVSGAVSLMLAVNPTLSASDIYFILRGAARAFPGGSNCSPSLCGAGILDVSAAVREAARRQGGINAPTSDGDGGGGGGGGCVTGGGVADISLPLLALGALLGRRRRGKRA
ncbi:MAG TPA: S8 family peptidase, partial [Burkholderiales bacterium]|nr:S8 family peptidase [Burkholderiales bacterium]